MDWLGEIEVNVLEFSLRIADNEDVARMSRALRELAVIAACANDSDTDGYVVRKLEELSDDAEELRVAAKEIVQREMYHRKKS